MAVHDLRQKMNDEIKELHRYLGTEVTANGFSYLKTTITGIYCKDCQCIQASFFHIFLILYPQQIILLKVTTIGLGQ